jgi:hypothetical protein
MRTGYKAQTRKQSNDPFHVSLLTASTTLDVARVMPDQGASNGFD